MPCCGGSPGNEQYYYEGYDKSADYGRTKFDQAMNKKFCHCNSKEGFAQNSYHAPQWPPQRTKYDQQLQQKWCPRCGKQFHHLGECDCK